MERDDFLYDPLMQTLESHQALAHTEQEQARLKEQEHINDGQYRRATRDLKQAVKENPGFEPIHQTAWASAIDRHRDDPSKIEQAATEITVMIEKLEAAANQKGVPIVMISEVGRDIDIFQTYGDGLRFDGFNPDVLQINAEPTSGGDQPTPVSIWMEKVTAVAGTVEEVDNLDLKDILADKHPRQVESILIIGQTPTARLVENLYSLPSSVSRRPIEYLLKRGESNGIDFERVSERLKEIIRIERSEKANSIAKTLFEIAARGYSGDVNFERLVSEAKREGVQPELVLVHIQKVRSESIQSTAAWQESLTNALLEYRRPTQQDST